MSNRDARREFWEQRSHMGAFSGTNDIWLNEIENRVLGEMVPEGSRVLDAGCGRGELLVRLVKRKGCTGVGVDFSQGMLREARMLADREGVGEQLTFHIRELPGACLEEFGSFDCAVTKRCIINLMGEEQEKGVREILDVVKPRGAYLMMEMCGEGLAEVNEWRGRLGLEPIAQPWHNEYLSRDVVGAWSEAWSAAGVARVEAALAPASTYYLASRVLYARLAADEGVEPDYTHRVNEIAAALPSVGDFGYSRLWVWRRLAWEQ